MNVNLNLNQYISDGIIIQYQALALLGSIYDIQIELWEPTAYKHLYIHKAYMCHFPGPAKC